MTDGYEEKKYEYKYDIDGNLVGWNREADLQVNQIYSGTTRYTFADGEKFFCNINYDTNKMITPRIVSTTILQDLNKDSDDDVNKPMQEYGRNYSYDEFGKMIEKKSFENKNEYNIIYDSNWKSQPSIFQYDFLKNGYTPPNSSELYNYWIHYNEKITYDTQGNICLNRINSSAERRIGGATIATEFIPEYTINKPYKYDSLNRLTKEIDASLGINRTFSYCSDGKINSMGGNISTASRCYYDEKRNLTEFRQRQYEYDLYGNRIKETVNGNIRNYLYTRGNFLSGINGNSYHYNLFGNRFKKVVNGVTINYYLDGGKILGEERSDGKKLRYFYDINGLCGVRYNEINYTYVTNAQGDVVMIVKGVAPVARYEYDAFGFCTVNTYGNDDIGNINLFRFLIL